MKRVVILLAIFVLVISACGPKPSSEESSPPGQASKIPIIVDDDGSMDGVVAMLYFLAHPDYEVIALTVNQGIAYPSQFSGNLGKLLNKIGRTGIEVGEGQDFPIAGDNRFAEDWRTFSSDFFGFPLPAQSEPVSELSASELMVRLIKESPQPVAIFASGSHTELALALRLDPSIADSILFVGVMGGALFVDGNISKDAASQGYTNTTAEWNIWVDPVAAREVFSSGLPIYLTPLDATDQVTWEKEFSARWEKSNDPAARLAGELVTAMNSWFGGYVYVWDLSAAIFTSDPALCESEKFFIEVITESGSDEGRTIATADEKGDVTACLDPNGPAFHARAEEVFK